jgi:hypothetical protein
MSSNFLQRARSSMGKFSMRFLLITLILASKFRIWPPISQTQWIESICGLSIVELLLNSCLPTLLLSTWLLHMYVLIVWLIFAYLGSWSFASFKDFGRVLRCFGSFQRVDSLWVRKLCGMLLPSSRNQLFEWSFGQTPGNLLCWTADHEHQSSNAPNSKGFRPVSL